MFGKDHGSFVPPSSSGEAYVTCDYLLGMADGALAEGSLSEAAHLYLAAFESSESVGSGTYQPAVDGLHKAWDAALRMKERALAEHVFEKLEPFIGGDDVASHAEALQRLALDKLEEFGFTRDDLKDMADMVTQDFADAVKQGNTSNAIVAHFTSSEKPSVSAAGVMAWPHGSKAEDGESQLQATRNPEEFSYADLVGYGRAIEAMHKRGIGLSGDEDFGEFMKSLSRRHGIDALPAYETMLFRSSAREDANQFMLSTAQELDAPTVRMFMEDTPMGFPVLCVMATSNFHMNTTRGGFDGPGTLVLEDIDLWGAPFSSEEEEHEGVPYYAYMSRGARDASMFIRSACDNPDVAVLATCGTDAPLDEFFIDLLGPISVVDIDLPDDAERAAVWKEACSLYPSLRLFANDDLVRLSANLSRYDIYLAAREAVEQAFKSSVEKRVFVPVTSDNLFNKIAAYQPLDSSEYQEIEQRAVENLLSGLDDLDDLLKGTE